MAKGRKKGGTDRWAAARAAKAARKAAGNGRRMREYRLLFREDGSIVPLTEATPLRFPQAEAALAVAEAMKVQFPSYEFFVSQV